MLLDFSSPALLDALLEHATRHALPVVIASTGHDAEAVARIQAAARRIPILRASNMSLGVAVLRHLVRMAQQALPGFDIEITEKHHHMKKDAPSGTALTLLEDLQQHNPALHKVPGRDGQVGARTQNEVGMHAVRGGTVVGSIPSASMARTNGGNYAHRAIPAHLCRGRIGRLPCAGGAQARPVHAG